MPRYNTATPGSRRCRSWRRGGGVVYRFGDFALDYDLRQLFLSRDEVHLSPKALELLVGAARQSVPRRLQGGAAARLVAVDLRRGDTNLAGLVLEVRRALRDSASHPMFVRTVYGFGYRFVGAVTVEATTTRSESRRARLSLEWASRRAVLIEGAHVLGREPDAAIQIDSPGVSRYHARILVTHGEATVEDSAAARTAPVSTATASRRRHGCRTAMCCRSVESA